MTSGENNVPSRSARFLLTAWYCTTIPVYRAHSCGQRKFSTVTSIIKHNGVCHSAIEALDDWRSCVSSRCGTSLEQFATFRLIVFIPASIEAEIFRRSNPAAEYWTNISRIKLVNIIWFYFVKWPWSSSELYVLLMSLVYNNNKFYKTTLLTIQSTVNFSTATMTIISPSVSQTASIQEINFRNLVEAGARTITSGVAAEWVSYSATVY